jgi:hypothetical protein
MDVDLVRQYEPVLRLTQGEMFRPVAVEDYLRPARLVLGRGGDARTLAEPGTLDPAVLAALGREHRGAPLSLQFVSVPLDRGAYRDWVRSGQRPAFHRSSAAARVGLIARVLAALARLSLLIRGRVPGGQAAAAQVQVDEHRPGCSYYSRVTRDAGYVAIQYWFLYPMNDWRSSFGGVNDHEGDWEQITVFLADTDDGPVPAWVAFSSHDEVGADLRRRWDDPDLAKEGDHPVVYVGAGSHSGAYLPGEYLVSIAPNLPGWLERLRRSLARILPWADPEGQIGIPFIDYRRGDGLTIGPGGDHNWQAQLIDESTDWVVDYAGLWGLDTHDPLGGERAPAGPRYERDGRVRASWAQPVAWADLDREPPGPSTRQALWAQRDLAVREQLHTVESELAVARADLRSATVAAGSPDPTSRPDRTELERASARVRDLRARQAQLAEQAEALERSEPGALPTPGVHDHLSHRALPMLAGESSGWALRAWSSVSAVLLFLAAGLVLLNGSSALLVPLLGLIAVMLLVEAILRRRMLDLLVRVAIAVAVGAGLLVVADIVLGHMRQTLGVLLLLGAGILAIQSLGEAGRRRGGST